MFKKILAAIGLVFIIVIVVTLYRFGMFKSVDVIETTSSQKFILGKYFEGDPKSEPFKAIFQEVGEMTESKEVIGKVCGVYLNNPEENKGIIKAFIGIWVVDSTGINKEGYSYYVVPERPVIQAHIVADFRVATFKSYTAIFDYSNDKNIPITDQFFEWFESREEVFVEVLKKQED